MKHLPRLILAFAVLFISFPNKVVAQQTKDRTQPELNVGVFGRTHSVIGQMIFDHSADITLPGGTGEFQSGNIVLVYYKPYGGVGVTRTMMFVCTKTNTTVRLRSVNENASLPIGRLDAIKSIQLYGHNIGPDQRQTLLRNCGDY